MPIRILIVEDEEQFATLCKNFIEFTNSEIKVDCVQNSEALIFDNDYDLIITDYSVLSNAVKKVLKAKYISNVIFFSGHSDTDHLALSNKYVWIQKPDVKGLVGYISNKIKMAS